MKKVFLLLIFGFQISLLSAQAPNHAKEVKSDPSLPTYLVDGVEMPYAKVVKLNTALIESMNVYKGPEAIAKFGVKYQHGIVLVKLKKGKK
jgi:hypothetical protein